MPVNSRIDGRQLIATARGRIAWRWKLQVFELGTRWRPAARASRSADRRSRFEPPRLACPIRTDGPAPRRESGRMVREGWTHLHSSRLQFLPHLSIRTNQELKNQDHPMFTIAAPAPSVPSQAFPPAPGPRNRMGQAAALPHLAADPPPRAAAKQAPRQPQPRARAALWRPHPRRLPLPRAGDPRQAPLPHAWRAEHRPAHGGGPRPPAPGPHHPRPLRRRDPRPRSQHARHLPPRPGVARRGALHRPAAARAGGPAEPHAPGADAAAVPVRWVEPGSGPRADACRGGSARTVEAGHRGGHGGAATRGGRTARRWRRRGNPAVRTPCTRSTARRRHGLASIRAKTPCT